MAQFTSDILTPEVGARLREARIAKGLSQADAAAKLRTTPHYIDRMDAGDVRSLPPEPYRKSFIKEYARIVGIKLESLMGDEPPPERKPEGLRAAVTSGTDVARKVSKEAASIASEVTKSTVRTTETVVKMAGEGVKEAVQELRGKELWEEAEQVRRERLGMLAANAEQPELRVRPKRVPLNPPEPPTPPVAPPEVMSEPAPQPKATIKQPTQRLNLDKEVRREAESYQPPESEEYESHTGTSRSTKIIVGLLIVIAAVVGYSVVTKRSKLPPPEPVVTEQTKPESKQIKKTPPAIVKTADTAAVVPTASDSALMFNLTAKEDVWVSVTPDVGNGFRGTMKAGETKSFSAKAKYIVYLGNQKSLSMTLNGRALSGLPTVEGSNMVVRNVLLTRDQAIIAPADIGPAEIKQQALGGGAATVSTPQVPAKRVTPTNRPQPPVHRTPRRSTTKSPSNGSVHKTIPTTPPVLPQAN